MSHAAAGREGKVLWDKSPPHEHISLRPVRRACVSCRHTVCARRSNVKLVLQRILPPPFFFFKAAKPAQNRLCWAEKGGETLILWIGEQESRRRWEARVVFVQHAESNLPKLLLCFFRLHRPLLLFRCNLDNEVNTNCLQPFYWQHALCFEFLFYFFQSDVHILARVCKNWNMKLAPNYLATNHWKVELLDLCIFQLSSLIGNTTRMSQESMVRLHRQAAICVLLMTSSWW